MSIRWILSFFIFQSCLTFSQVTNAAQLKNSCGSLFVATPPLSPVPFTEKDLKVTTRRMKWTPESSVAVVKKIFDELGRSLFVFKKVGEYWASGFAPAPNNFQGDPRWFPMLLGGKVAAFFGFKKIDNDHMTAPTAQTLNESIERLNSVFAENGREAIEIRYHGSGLEAENGVSFLQNLINHSSLPIAKEGHYAVHDIAYHALAILLPKEILDGLKKRASILLQLHEKIEADQKIDPTVKKLLKKSITETIDDFVRYVDFGTGNLGYYLTMEKKNQLNARDVPYQAYDLSHAVIQNLNDQTQMLMEDIQHRVKMLFSEKILYSYGYAEQVKEYIPVEMPMEERKAYVAKIEAMLNPAINKLLTGHRLAIRASKQEIRTESFVQFVRQRIQDIQEAVTKVPRR